MKATTEEKGQVLSPYGILFRMQKGRSFGKKGTVVPFRPLVKADEADGK